MNKKKQELLALKEKYEEQKYQIKLKYSLDPQKTTRRYERKVKNRELTKTMPKRYSIGEEIFNSVSHGVGAGLSIAAIVLLIVHAALDAPANMKAEYIVSFSIYGVTLLILYLMSTLYHALTPYNVKNVFAVFDHSSIYILIAGTYTPYCLCALDHITGWIMLGIIWSLAIFGVTVYCVFGNKLRIASAFTYLPMGLLILFAIKQLLVNLPAISIIFLVLGGFFYVVGWPFYLFKKQKWFHCVFHMFVLAGSIFHFFSVMLFI
ncbi:MAG: PAQR family membrane homeostasis protein TrhA [Treponemataceae bacterium]